ncbi:hypothetical protein BV327_05085 [Pseudomonas syringae pv. actinidiae]|nr:hypothetical protein BV327_05085 [Pseudomonas syringae pv. actinidiae]
MMLTPTIRNRPHAIHLAKLGDNYFFGPTVIGENSVSVKQLLPYIQTIIIQLGASNFPSDKVVAIYRNRFCRALV